MVKFEDALAEARGTVIVEFVPESLERMVELWNRSEVKNDFGDTLTMRAVHVEGPRWTLELLTVTQ